MHRIILVFALLIYFNSYSQKKVKSPISIADFAEWNVVNDQQISHNGKIVTYEVNQQKGDGLLVIYRPDGSDTISRGFNAKISPDNDFVVFKIKQPHSIIRKAKIDKVKKDDFPSDSLGIFVFNNESVVKFPGLESFAIPEENADWISFMTKKIELKDTTSNKSKKKIKQPGNDLVMFNVKTADTLVFRNVTEYFYSKEGKNVIFISQRKDSTNTFSTTQLFNTENGNVEILFNSPGFAKKAITDKAGGQFAFLYSNDTIKEKIYKLYLGSLQASPEVIADSYTMGMPVGWSPSENGRIYFSENGLKLYFGTAKSPEPESKDSLIDEEQPKLDIWHWQDKTLQPQQKINSKREKNRTYTGVYHTDIKRFVQLGNLYVKTVSTIQKGNGETALGRDDSPYLRSSSWTGERNNDYYLIDLMTGINRQILKNESYVRLSPGGKYIIWYNYSDSSYYARSTNINNLEDISLTKSIPVTFYNELHDTPSNPRPYGIAGWSEDDKHVFIYDRYDIWKIDPAGVRVPVNITKAFGRRNKSRLRYVRLDSDEEFIPINKSLLLQIFDERTISSGYFKTTFNSVKTPELLLVDKYSFSRPIKAKNADHIIWTKENVETYPDIWLSNLNIKNPKKISDINPQQENFNWVTVEMIEWTSFTGETLKGMLYKPENFNPAQKYPTIVYFYERSIQTLHRHYTPYPSRSTINKTFYPSNGFLVFIPDVTYKTGYPGQSAYNSIVSGVNYLINKFSFVDSKKIALQGQSWGGYQIAHLITQTDMFAAAMGGAPVSNMTSAYGGIRWATGMSRMFQYEHTQSRIGGTLWEKPLLYIENSPVFHAPKIKTPLLMMHNDNDGAVPWYQGIEMFVALRRLDKPVWMLTYNDEPHNLKASSWANRVDLSKRMFQFFNHYLKGKPMPEWMEKGIPAIDKGKNLGYE